MLYTAFINCWSIQNIFNGQEKQFWANNIEEKAIETSRISSSERSHKNKQYNQVPTQPQINKQK